MGISRGISFFFFVIYIILLYLISVWGLTMNFKPSFPVNYKVKMHNTCILGVWQLSFSTFTIYCTRQTCETAAPLNIFFFLPLEKLFMWCLNGHCVNSKYFSDSISQFYRWNAGTPVFLLWWGKNFRQKISNISGHTFLADHFWIYDHIYKFSHDSASDVFGSYGWQCLAQCHKRR